MSDRTRSQEELMRRTIHLSVAAALLISLAALPAFAAQAPAPAASSKEALDVLGKMIEAMGGRKVLESIKDTTISGQLEIAQAGTTITAPITIYQKEPNKMRLDITIAEYNMSITQATDGQKAWFTNAQTGTTEEMPDFMAKEFARQAWATRPSSNREGRRLRPEAQGVDRGQGLHRPRPCPMGTRSPSYRSGDHLPLRPQTLPSTTAPRSKRRASPPTTGRSATPWSPIPCASSTTGPRPRRSRSRPSLTTRTSKTPSSS
jgi:hypothetical protein